MVPQSPQARPGYPQNPDLSQGLGDAETHVRLGGPLAAWSRSGSPSQQCPTPDPTLFPFFPDPGCTLGTQGQMAGVPVLTGGGGGMRVEVELNMMVLPLSLTSLVSSLGLQGVGN